MESLKGILLLIVLGCVGYGVYVALNHAPPSEPAPVNAAPWKKPAGGESGASTSPGSASPGTNAPPSTSMTPLPRDPFAVAPVDKTASNESKTAFAPSATASPTASPGISLPFGIGSSTPQQPVQSMTTIRTEMSAPPTTAVATSGGIPAAVTSPTPQQSDADALARHEFDASMRTADSLARSGKLVEALRELSQWHDHSAVPPEQQAMLANMLSQLAGTVIYSRQHWLASPYVVRPGETLETIAQQCEVPWQLLAKINGIANPNTLMPGEELKILRGPFTAQLNLQRDSLTLFIDGMYAGKFRVQGGRNLMKPEGKYAVAKFNAADPGNATQRPYISLGGDLQLRVPDDAAVQTPGSVVISPGDMNDLFDMLSSRSEVTIRR